MKKRLMVGLLSAGLMVVMLPGLTAAKDDGKSDCKKDHWTDWVRDDGSAFADQAECVAYVAEGGTLTNPMPATAFALACLTTGGQYGAPLTVYTPSGSLWGTYPEGCTWYGIGQATWFDYHHNVVGPLCTTGSSSGGGPDWGWDPAWVGCELGD